MKRKTYKTAVQWIADNDEPTQFDAYEVSGFISVQLVADLYGKDSFDVALDVVNVRLHQAIING